MEMNEVREKYLQFFAARGHAVIPSASLVPQNDPTTLFTSSGMQPLVPYLLGEPHPKGTRLCDSQKSFRAEDIEEVGDNRHTTFFEMLGNWSLGDYFKEEQLPWIYEFLIKDIGLDPSRLYATVFDGDPSIGVPRDEESITLLRKIFADAGVSNGFQAVGTEAAGYEKGMEHGARIFSYEAKKNWWSRSGVPSKMPEGEIGGPDSEIFYDFDPTGATHDTRFGAHCHPNCDCGRFMEIGNSVFIQFVKKNGAFEQLSQKNVDFGGGLERVLAAARGTPDVFQATDTLRAIITALEEQSAVSYEKNKVAYRVIADHMRGAVFMLTDGVLPSNTEQGYFLRRLIRRAVRYADVLGLPVGKLSSLARIVADSYGTHYPEVVATLAHTTQAIADEESRFRETLSRGMREFERLSGSAISGRDAFVLFTTYGFPVELTVELARERGASVDMEAFKEEMQKHQEASRAGAEQKFKGGLADASEQTTRLHTAHHLLLKALQNVLGPEVKQRGSNITAERLRIDFSYGQKMTDEQKKEVERIVNEKIHETLPVTRTVMPREEAERLGAQHEFGAKYPDMVSVYSVGPKDATEAEPKFNKAFSIEFCGGPHVGNTSELGEKFTIQKEEAVAAGIRRIKATLV